MNKKLMEYKLLLEEEWHILYDKDNNKIIKTTNIKPDTVYENVQLIEYDDFYKLVENNETGIKFFPKENCVLDTKCDTLTVSKDEDLSLISPCLNFILTRKHIYSRH